jgi:nucleoside-diphosphate kinase
MKSYCLIIFKPDAIAENLVGTIITDFKRRDFVIETFDLKTVTPELIFAHYAEVIAKLGDGFKKQVEACFVGKTMLPVIVSQEGADAIANARALTGATDPSKAAADTIRGHYGHDSLAEADAQGRTVNNLIHCCDSPESFKNEASLWFSPELLDPAYFEA